MCQPLMEHQGMDGFGRKSNVKQGVRVRCFSEFLLFPTPDCLLFVDLHNQTYGENILLLFVTMKQVHLAQRWKLGVT